MPRVDAQSTLPHEITTKDALLVLTHGGTLLHLLEDDRWVLITEDGQEHPIGVHHVMPLRREELLEFVAFHEGRYAKFALTPAGHERAERLPGEPFSFDQQDAPPSEAREDVWNVLMLIRLHQAQAHEDGEGDGVGERFLCWRGGSEDLERLLERAETLEVLRDGDPDLAEMHYEAPSTIVRLDGKAQEVLDLDRRLEGHVLLVRGDATGVLPDQVREEAAEVTLCVDETSMYFHAEFGDGNVRFSADVDPAELVEAVGRALRDADATTS